MQDQRVHRCVLFCLVVVFACAVLGASSEGGRSPGLSVRQGVLLRQGAPYQGVGVNYFSLFSRTLKNPADRSYEAGLKQLADAHIPFVRFMACGFWPVDWDLYLNDKEAYFKRLDAVVGAAERCNVGLIPSLFWHLSTVSDLVNEPIDCLGDPQSKTLAFIRQYTREIVMRYQNSPAIWAWEFGNEYNLAADLPNAAQHRPPVWPKLKTAAQRTSRDELTSTAMLVAFHAMAQTVRQYDPHRLIITGNSIPRACAYHNTHEKNWKPDSLEQWRSVLLRDNPDPFGVLCVHVYPEKKGGYPLGAKEPQEILMRVQQLAQGAKKPLFVGEFGSPVAEAEAERATFVALLGAIEKNRIPLSAVWVFDYSAQDKEWNITFSNSRAYMLKQVGEANQRMQVPVRGAEAVSEKSPR